MNFTLGLGLTETLDAGPQATPSPGREPTADAEADFSAIIRLLATMTQGRGISSLG